MVASRYGIGFFLSLFLCLAMFGGCSSQEVGPINPNIQRDALVGKVWQCQKMFQREVVGDVPLTLEFLSDGTVQGSSGCNSFHGTYTLTGEEISLGKFTTTRKACLGVLGEQEHTYLFFLGLVNRVQVDGESLELRTPKSDTSMCFTTGDHGWLW